MKLLDAGYQPNMLGLKPHSKLISEGLCTHSLVLLEDFLICWQ